MKINYLDRKAIGSIYGTKKYVQMKDITDIPKSTLEQIKLISLPIAKTGSPFGSYVNRMSDYYGDIDVIQLVADFKNIKEVGPKTAKAIQDVVTEIDSKRVHWFSEFKAGIDISYYFDIGTLKKGVYTFSNILVPTSEQLYGLKLLNDEEISIIRKITEKKKGNGDDYDVIFNLFREHFLLRWTLDEIKQGWKKTSLGEYSLANAVLDKTAVKIDMIIATETGKFIEVTNFIALGINEGGYFKSINVDESALTPANLPIEIEKLYYSNFYYKPFKLIKRSFAYLKWLSKNGFPEIEIALDPFIKILKTSVNILYTVNSELDAINIVLKLKNPPLAKINKRLDQLRDPISNVLELDSTQLASIMKLLDGVIEATRGYKVILINGLMDIFKQVINFWTIAYMDQLKLNPPPQFVLPPIMSYDPKIFREPWSNPINIYREVRGGCLSCSGTCGGSWFGDIAASIFKGVANTYRRNFCNGKARPLLQGEYHYGCHNFTGPGTRVDLKEVKDYPPYNNIDKCSKQHDMDYVKAVELPDKERIEAIKKADKDVIGCYDKYPNENGYNVAKLGINSKMTLAKVLPLVSKSVFGKISASGKDKGLRVLEL